MPPPPKKRGNIPPPPHGRDFKMFLISNQIAPITEGKKVKKVPSIILDIYIYTYIYYTFPSAIDD